MTMEIEKEIECALSAGGDWADLYRCHLRAVKQPLTFKLCGGSGIRSPWPTQQTGWLYSSRRSWRQHWDFD
jgi:hypothetical protein